MNRSGLRMPLAPMSCRGESLFRFELGASVIVEYVGRGDDRGERRLSPLGSQRIPRAR